MVKKGRCCDNTPHHIHASGASWTEMKLRDMVRGGEVQREMQQIWLGFDWILHNSGQVHLGSSVHLNSDIIPEYKASEAWKAPLFVRWGGVLPR